MPTPNHTCPVCKELAETLEEIILILGKVPRGECTRVEMNILREAKEAINKYEKTTTP